MARGYTTGLDDLHCNYTETPARPLSLPSLRFPLFLFPARVACLSASVALSAFLPWILSAVSSYRCTGWLFARARETQTVQNLWTAGDLGTLQSVHDGTQPLTRSFVTRSNILLRARKREGTGGIYLRSFVIGFRKQGTPKYWRDKLGEKMVSGGSLFHWV